MKRKSLSNKEKYDMKMKFYKLKDNSKFDLLKLYPTLFGSDNPTVSPIIPTQYPNLLFSENAVLSANLTTVEFPVISYFAYSKLTPASVLLIVPYVITFQTLVSGGLSHTSSYGLGLTNTSYGVSGNQGDTLATGYGGSGWNDSLNIDVDDILPRLRSTTTKSNVQLSQVTLSNSGVFGNLNGSNLLTIQEYRPGEIWIAVTNVAGTVFVVPWTQLTSPWTSLVGNRVISVIFHTNGVATFSSGITCNLVATPAPLILFNQ